MKVHAIFLTAFLFLLSMPLVAKRAPHLRFDITWAKDMKFEPVQGSAIFSMDSNFSIYDTVRHRFFSIKKGDGGNNIWCEILTPVGHADPNVVFWKLILTAKDGQQLVSNAFKISNYYATLKTNVSDAKLEIFEKQTSVHKDEYYFAIALLVLVVIKFLGFALFFAWTDSWRMVLGRYFALLIAKAVILFAWLEMFLAIGFERWTALSGLAFLFVLECGIVKRYILPQTKGYLIFLTLLFISFFTTTAFVFVSFWLSFAE